MVHSQLHSCISKYSNISSSLQLLAVLTVNYSMEEAIYRLLIKSYTFVFGFSFFKSDCCFFDNGAFCLPGWSQRAIHCQRAASRPGRLQSDPRFVVRGSELQRRSLQEAARIPETPECSSDPGPGLAEPQPPEIKPSLGGEQLVLH